MRKFDNIVVGLDISKTSISILKKAFLLAKINNSKITIVHAIVNNWFTELFTPVKLEKVQKHTTKNIQKVLEEIDTIGIEYSIIIGKDTASNFVVDTAKTIDASLIVIGANEKEDQEIALLGSTAHKIAQNSNIPLLIVKNSSEISYENIVSFTDLSEVSYSSFIFAKDFFKTNDVKIIYAYNQMSEFTLKYYEEFENKESITSNIHNKEQEKVETFKEKYNIKNLLSIESDKGISSALLDHVNANHNDLVIMGSKGLNNSTSFIYGSTTSYLMENLQSDLLIYVSK